MAGSRSRYSFEGIASDLSDCIGIERDADLTSIVDLGCISTRRMSGSERRRTDRMDKEFPPPIPWLARTENLPGFMKRYYTDDGRLVIVEEKVQKQDYFRADRSDGRLTLRLILIKDDENVAADDEKAAGAGTKYQDTGVLGGDVEEGDDQTVEGEESIMTTNLGNGVAVIDNGSGVGSGGGKFYHQYCNLSRNSCMFGGGGGGVAVAAVRSVHT